MQPERDIAFSLETYALQYLFINHQKRNEHKSKSMLFLPSAHLCEQNAADRL